MLINTKHNPIKKFVRSIWSNSSIKDLEKYRFHAIFSLDPLHLKLISPLPEEQRRRFQILLTNFTTSYVLCSIFFMTHKKSEMEKTRSKFYWESSCRRLKLYDLIYYQAMKWKNLCHGRWLILKWNSHFRFFCVIQEHYIIKPPFGF